MSIEDGSVSEAPEHAEMDAMANLLIGRTLRPDEQAAIMACRMDAATGVLHLRAFLEQTHQLHMERHEFSFLSDGLARLLIIGEHATGLGRVLAGRCELPVLGRRFTPHVPSIWEDVRRASHPDAKALILLGDDVGEAAVEAAHEAGFEPIRAQTIHFGGLHPDAVYLAKLPISPPGVGGWHSALVLDAYLAGLPSKACRARFSHETYSVLGYYDRFDSELEALHRRDEGMDVHVARLFAERVRNRPLMRTPHDGSILLHELYAEALAPRLGLALNDRLALGTESTTSPVLPVPGEIANRHRLRYDVPTLFSRETEAFGLDEMIQRAYNNYRWWPRHLLADLFEKALRERKLQALQGCAA